MNDNNNLVWYAAYGSNLLQERFICYIEGGKPEGAANEYPPCADTSAPREARNFDLQHELIFAKNSRNWQMGGVAFVKREHDPECATFARIYLITREQFHHVAQWETGGNPIDDINIDEAIAEGSTVFKRPSWYGLVVYLGEVDNIPVFTLTDEAAITAYSKPSPQYLTQIVNGLRETYNYTNNEIYQYLKTKNGVVGNYKDFELFDVAAGLLNPKRDLTKKLLSDFAKEYDGMPEGEAKQQMKLAMDEFMRKYYDGFNFDYLE